MSIPGPDRWKPAVFPAASPGEPPEIRWLQSQKWVRPVSPAGRCAGGLTAEGPHEGRDGYDRRDERHERAETPAHRGTSRLEQEGKHDKPADDTEPATDSTDATTAKEARNGGKPDAAAACAAYLAQLDTKQVVNLLVRSGHGGIVALEILADRDKPAAQSKPATVTAPESSAEPIVPVQKTRTVRRAGQHRTHLASVTTV